MRHSSRVFRSVRGFAALLAVVALNVGSVTLVRAATFTPTDAATLIADIATANTNGQDNTITLTAGATYTLTAANNGTAGDENGLPVIASSGHTLTINGNGATITRGSGAPNFRFFTVNSGATLVLNQVNLSNGKLVGPNGVGAQNATDGSSVTGGAINNNGTLNITGGAFSGNSLTGGNGGNSTSTGSMSGRNGNGGSSTGGAINNAGTLTVSTATFSANSVTGGNNGTTICIFCFTGTPGSGKGGAISNSSALAIVGGTYTGNSAIGGDGPDTGVAAYGGALFDSGNAVTISGNASFTQNSALGGHIGPSAARFGLSKGGAVFSAGTSSNTFHINDATIAQNTVNGRIGEGGGISYQDGTLTLTISRVRGNTVTSTATVAQLSGGGIAATGFVTVTISTIRDNQVTVSVSDASGTGFGGGISFFDSFGNLRLINSDILGNSVTVTSDPTAGNVAVVGGGIYTRGGLTLTGSTVSNNTVTNASPINGGGSHYASGGGVMNVGATGSTITFSTISGNTLTAPSGTTAGGIYNDASGHQMTITNSTISGNTATTGGGAFGNSGTMAFVNSTVASNSTGVNAAANATFSLQNTILANASTDCSGSGTYSSAGYNLSRDHTCDSFLTGAHDLKGVDPALDTLKVNAPGTTATHALLPGSAAIDQIPNAGGCNNAGITTDQRGVARPQPAGGLCDIGAFEVQANTAAPTITGISPPSGPTTGGSRVTISGTGFVNGATVMFGSANATNCAVVNATTLTCTTPAHGAGTVDVVVTNPDSQSGTRGGGYTYVVVAPLPPGQPPGTGGGPSSPLPPPRPPGTTGGNAPSPLPQPRP